MIILLSLIVILLFSSFGIAQDSKAVQIDEFGDFNCETFLARTDFFYIHLNNNPTTKIYLVVSGDISTTRKKLAVELLRESALAARKYDGVLSQDR